MTDCPESHWPSERPTIDTGGQAWPGGGAIWLVLAIFFLDVLNQYLLRQTTARAPPQPPEFSTVAVGCTTEDRSQVVVQPHPTCLSPGASVPSLLVIKDDGSVETALFCCVLSYYGNSLKKESICFFFFPLNSAMFSGFPKIPSFSWAPLRV